MSDLVQKAKRHFLETMKRGTPAYNYFPEHIKEVEKWAIRILKYAPKANKEVLLTSVWLHDIGHADGDYKIDHAIKSENEAKNFLSGLKVNKLKIKNILHCVRSHRCKDVRPQTQEAKVLAAADSASHMTSFAYIAMMQDGASRERILKKLERDFRDKNYLPAPLAKELAPLYKAWKELLKIFPESRN